MTRLLHPLGPLLARAADHELARMVAYLRAENRILRDKLPRRITVTPAERQRLVRLGARLGAAVKGLVSIVSPGTFARRLRGEQPGRQVATRKPGRPRTPNDVRALVLRLARETG